ncbi:unnamed protein product [Rotaria socialis]
MNRSNVHLLDLPNEILLTILRKLNNMDVLYSLLDINNGRLDIIMQEKRDESSLRSVFQQQITSLTLVTNDKSARVGSSKQYTRNVYAYILNFFKNLTHLNIIGPYVMLCPGLSLRDLPSTTFYSSILTHLCIIVENFDDCLYLLDGRPETARSNKSIGGLLENGRDGFKHEFFVRIARSFPLLKYLRIYNIKPQVSTDPTLSSDHSQLYSMIEYPHLMSLDVAYSNKCYLEQFLNETKACVPCLIELAMSQYDLKIVTNNFTREETRRNCAKVKQLISIQPLDNSQDLYHYFPSL